MLITNHKIQQAAPLRWAPFAGTSRLFDTPGDNLSPLSGGLRVLSCAVDSSPDLHFYKALNGTLGSLDTLTVLRDTYGFCPLPPTSYHVTYQDGVNVANVDKVVPMHRSRFEAHLKQLPESLPDFVANAEAALASGLVQNLTGFTVRFEFAALSLWGNSVLVAQVRPTDETRETYEWLARERSSSYREWQSVLGSMYGEPTPEAYCPHVSLGYFANKEGAELFSGIVPQWARAFEEGTRGLMIEFSSISLYGFTDMATFFRV